MKNKFTFKNNLTIIHSNVKEIKNNELIYDPNTEDEQRFVYEGTKVEWAQIKKGKSVLDIPCIKCTDGLFIQRI